jgi:hypothetical protein
VNVISWVVAVRSGLGLLALALMVLCLEPGIGRSETLKVGRPNQVLYPDPDFASPPLGQVPLDSEVDRLLSLGDWFKVSHQDRKGWMNRSAFPQLKPPPQQMPGLLTGTGVKPGFGDEVALGGKAERMPPTGPPRLEDDRKTMKREQALYRDPDPGEPPMGSVPAGEKVTVMIQAGEWVKVKYGGEVGWLPKDALNF